MHRFASGRPPLILCGVEIPSAKGLLGHSDADVAVHALMDALLGAVGRGDIGEHFPDSDPKLENVSSLKLLREVVALLQRDKLVVNNVDLTIMAEEPKLAPPHKGGLCGQNSRRHWESAHRGSTLRPQPRRAWALWAGGRGSRPWPSSACVEGSERPYVPIRAQCRRFKDYSRRTGAEKKELARGRREALFSVFDEVLGAEERVALEFLYAFMPFVDLADYDGSLFLQHVRHSLQAKNTLPWGAAVSGGDVSPFCLALPHQQRDD